MDHSENPRGAEDGFPPPLTPERIQRARAYIAQVHDDMRRRGVDLSRLPDPVEELSKAREAGGWD